MFKIVMITAAIIVVLGWIAYGVWRIVTSYTEGKRPRQSSEHLQQARKTMEDYAKKLKDYDYKKKPYQRQEERGK
jgi:Tfp pilus assembly protein PilE